jgi:hypothetical protein
MVVDPYKARKRWSSHTSEVVSKTILMGQPGLSFYVPVVRSIITLLIPYIILKKDVAIVSP